MARPIKHGLDYFPFDVDFFSDEKLYAISGEFGIKGEITTIKLLCAVYRNGYYIEWTEMLKFKLLKELPGVSADLLDQIIKRLVKWDFFNKDLFDSASILTSKGIQRRYQAISTKMHRKNAITEYCLLDTPVPAPAKQTPPSPPSPKAPKVVTQPAPPVADAPAPVFKQKSAPVPLDDSIAAMLSDTIWSEPVCMRYNLTSEQFKHKVANFKLHCLSREKREHDDVTDAKRHFCNLLSQGKLNDVSATIADNSPTDYTYSGGFGSKDI
ncbi:DUF4373 domain-containing protein [Muribaculum intestinale]|jgi:hypothetical protein|uniref:DUF4373 domain-containing protein n=1 Tax=Muribaculum intestinale TaxID=1796646 RepID=UPI0025B32C25|nr:DUF4373 domain-containing protein [Muribaculum intestinale]